MQVTSDFQCMLKAKRNTCLKTDWEGTMILYVISGMNLFARQMHHSFIDNLQRFKGFLSNKNGSYKRIYVCIWYEAKSVLKPFAAVSCLMHSYLQNS